jgi:predicted nucleic acid-binding protein
MMATALWKELRLIRERPDPREDALGEEMSEDDKKARAEAPVLAGCSRDLVEDAHEIAGRTGAAVCDRAFPALALRKNLALWTRDGREARVFESERGKRAGRVG